MSVDQGTKASFELLSPSEKARIIIEERTPKPELVIYQPTVSFLDEEGRLTREERAKVIAMGDRTAIAYENLAGTVIKERGNLVEVEGEKMSSQSAFFMQYALAAKSSKEIAHSSILEQLDPGPNEIGGNSSIILEGVSVLAGLKEVCALRHFGFEAFSSRGGIFPIEYYRIPNELEVTNIGPLLLKKTEQMDSNYRLLTEKLLIHYLENTPKNVGEKLWQYKWRVLNKALDDSRQVTSGVYLSHIAMHPNSALSIREGIAELSGSELPEVRAIADKLRILGEAGLPNLMRHTEVTVFTSSLNEKRETLKEMLARSNQESHRGEDGQSQFLDLQVLNSQPDREFLSAFLSEKSDRGIISDKQLIELSDEQVLNAVNEVFRGMTIHDKPPKSLEVIQINLKMLWNTGALYEALRHRLVTHTVSQFTIDNGYTMPAIFERLGLAQRYHDTIKLSEECYELVEGLGDNYKQFKEYFVTRAHLVEHQMRLSGTDLFHFLKLRTGPGAHADIAGPSAEIVQKLQSSGVEIFKHLQLKK